MKRIAFLLTMIMVLALLVACTATEPKSYTVNFVVNGEVVSSTVYEEGATPTAPTVEDYSTNWMTYEFSGWDKEVVAVSGDVTYTAVFTSTVREYDVTFIYGGATTGTPVKVTWGATPNAPTTGLNYETVDKVYTFVGWDKTVGPVTQDVVYTARYKSVPQVYDVTFVYEGGNKTVTVPYEYGATPVAPTKAGDYYHTVEKTYTFSAWDKTIAPVTGDVTYTASYTEAPRSYVITFVVLGQENTTATLTYGATVTLPTPAATVVKDGKTYTFAGWDNDATTVSGDATYTAVYTLPIYSENFDDEGDFTANAVTKSFGAWSFTLKSGYSIKPVAGANGNQSLELYGTAGAAASQIGIKDSTGLVMGDCTKLTISFDLGKKDGVALSDTYIRFRSTTSKYVKFFVTAQADNSITFCGTKLKDSEGNLIALSETLKNFKMEFDFAAGTASIAVDGVVIVADASLYNNAATGWTDAHGTDMLNYISKCTQYVFQWAVNSKSVETGMLLDNMTIYSHT